ncbi:MAG TPA: hypothetical protein VF727_11630 [Allosphingosinicella sp.]|jgi:tetratricopeptide (TPR) repeat protein
MSILLPAAFLLAAAAPPAAPPAAPQEAPAIVVTGQRIADSEASLRACLARRCPPNEDIDASLGHAEALLAAGDYEKARRALLQSLDRNKDEAKRYPVAVSDLWRANGRVAAHLGLDRSYYFSTVSILRALKAGLPKEDVRQFGARMEIAAMMGRLRGHEAARHAYGDIARDARRQGRPDIAAMAELRSIMNHYPPHERPRLVRAIARSNDPQMRAAALEARLALLNLAKAEGNKEQVALLSREFAGLKANKPILIYSPPYDMIEHEVESPTDIFHHAYQSAPGGITRVMDVAAFSTTKRDAPGFDDMWIDVGFWVTPEGKVGDLQVLRKSGDTFWAAPLLASIARRLYTPGNGQAVDSYRVERYTYTSGFEAQTGTHLQGRGPKGRIEYLDMTPEGLASPS